MDRQVRYNSQRSKDNSECMEWFFLIVNEDKREICDISNRIYDLFAPIEDAGRQYEGKFEGTKFFYSFIDLLSKRKTIKSDLKGKIYHGTMLLDRKLCPRDDPDGLEKYISNLSE